MLLNAHYRDKRKLDCPALDYVLIVFSSLENVRTVSNKSVACLTCLASAVIKPKRQREF